jgi:sirohydrochlorin cobaltochelatase
MLLEPNPDDLRDIALVLCSHGIAGRPGAAADHAQRLRKRGLFAEVAAACINGAPDIAHIVDQMSAPRIVLVPFLMAAGRTSGSVLPARIEFCRRRGDVVLAEPVGTEPAVANLIVAAAHETAACHEWADEKTLVVLVAHGTIRDPQSGAAARDHAARIAATGRFAAVAAGYLDEPPSVGDLLAARDAPFAVGIGLFADAGPHGAGDAAAPFGTDFASAYAGPVGPLPAMTEIVLARAIAALAARH